MTTKTLDLNNIERKIFWILAFLLGVVVLFSSYSVATLSIAVVERNTANSAAHELAVKSGSLEAQYISQSNAVTLSYAKELGFSEVNAKFAGDNRVKLSMAR